MVEIKRDWQAMASAELRSYNYNSRLETERVKLGRAGVSQADVELIEYKCTRSIYPLDMAYRLAMKAIEQGWCLKCWFRFGEGSRW